VQLESSQHFREIPIKSFVSVKSSLTLPPKILVPRMVLPHM